MMKSRESYQQGLDVMSCGRNGGLSRRLHLHLVDEMVGGFGDGVGLFDNHVRYSAGDLCRHNERYWRAVRDVDPPWLPSIQSGEVPGESDAWKPVGASAVRAEVLGSTARDAIGMIDIQAWQHQMNTIKQVPISVANVMLRYGQQAIDQARAVAAQKKSLLTGALPGETDRETVYGKLKWHQSALTDSNNAIAQLRSNPTAYGSTAAEAAGADQKIYAPGNDLQHWVLQAFMEANAVEEGAAYLDQSWAAMWKEIGTELAKLPKEALKAVGTAAGGIVEAVTGVPLWVWLLGGAVATAGAGYLGYKLLKTPAGGALVGHYLARR